MIPEDWLINKDKGILIAFEGISGSGKSEGITRLVEYFREKKYPMVLIEWNSNPGIRKMIKLMDRMRILTPTVYSMLQWLSFLLDYFFKIIPFLRKNYIVIVDRYFYTGLTRDQINRANRTTGKIIGYFARKPDLLLFYDTELQICYERIKGRGKVLFHPNQKIHRNSLLKNRELYYLKKLLYQYRKLLADPKLHPITNILFLKEVENDLYSIINSYIDRKLYHRNETMRLNPNESIWN
jgi:dTMP kinase